MLNVRPARVAATFAWLLLSVVSGVYFWRSQSALDGAGDLVMLLAGVISAYSVASGASFGKAVSTPSWIRFVQYAAGAVLLAAGVASLLSDRSLGPLLGLFVSAKPAWHAMEVFLAVALMLTAYLTTEPTPPARATNDNQR